MVAEIKVDEKHVIEYFWDRFKSARGAIAKNNKLPKKVTISTIFSIYCWLLFYFPLRLYFTDLLS